VECIKKIVIEDKVYYGMVQYLLPSWENENFRKATAVHSLGNVIAALFVVD
jgi:hypothetical protein